MLNERAYCHHYEQCGHNLNDMEMDFAKIEDVIEGYSNL